MHACPHHRTPRVSCDGHAHIHPSKGHFGPLQASCAHARSCHPTFAHTRAPCDWHAQHPPAAMLRAWPLPRTDWRTSDRWKYRSRSRLAATRWIPVPVSLLAFQQLCLHALSVFISLCRSFGLTPVFPCAGPTAFGRDRPLPRLGGLHPAGGRPNPFCSPDRTHTR